jgi:hypothetical protein
VSTVNPVLAANLRRHWQLIGAIAAFVIFSAIHLLAFRPAAARYRAALDNAGGLDAVFESGALHPMLPPRIFALITANSLSPQDAVDRGASGALGVILLEELGRIASRAGMSVLASEPGVVTQEPLAAQVRAHLRMRGRYDEAVDFFAELARADALTLVERFSITPGNDGAVMLDIWVSRLYLKQARPSR